MRRKKKNSMKMTKQGQIFITRPGNLISIGVSSADFPKFPSSEPNNKRRNVKAYYEEMKPLLLTLRVFGLLPYHLTSEGKFSLVNCDVSLI
jgi:hypothetical protein